VQVYKTILSTLQVIWAEQQHEKIRVKRGHFHDRMIARGIVPRFTDPLWDAQWYLVSYYDVKMSIISPVIKLKIKLILLTAEQKPSIINILEVNATFLTHCSAEQCF